MVTALCAQEATLDEVYELPGLSVSEVRVANTEPASTFATPITVLRYEPRVDIQSRGYAETQADITVRGGIFENTGFRIGAVTIFDPQTGHFFSELPIDPTMLTAPKVLTGVDNALAGFNSNVATLDYSWTPLTNYGRATVGFGNDGLNFQQIGAGYVFKEAFLGDKTLAGEISYSRSESDGTIPFADHDFDRISARLQLADDHSQTDFFAGYQEKFFGWPGSYTGDLGNLFIGRLFYEVEKTNVEIYGANHRQEYAGDSFLEFGGYYRRVRDDYDTNRTAPKVTGSGGAFEHLTQAIAMGVQGYHAFDTWALNYSTQFTADELLNSTDLTFPSPNPRRFFTRRYIKVTVLPEIDFDLADDWELTLRAGTSFDDSNRDSAALAPQLDAVLEQTLGAGVNRYFAGYSRTSQVPGYTILASNPNGGLFRGSPTADREVADSFEIGFQVERKQWTGHFAAYHRRDDNLIDWTYTAPALNAPPAFTARNASPVDLKTYGIEAIGRLQPVQELELILGYSFLHKDSDYQGQNVDSSFYALNYANHRWTASVLYRPLKWIELRMDNEYRIQEDNVLRARSGTSEADYIGSVGVGFTPSQIDGLSIDAVVDNFTDSNFQEFPGTPAARRQAAVSVTYNW